MRIYLICPVRNCNAEARRCADEYVERLEGAGHDVHYPPRDVDQSEDGIGLAISEAHREAMLGCDEVHVLWDPESMGSHFDLGMAFMLRAVRACPLVLAAPVEATTSRSYGNLLDAIAANGGKAGQIVTRTV